LGVGGVVLKDDGVLLAKRLSSKGNSARLPALEL
jgi:hypothetical protein